MKVTVNTWESDYDNLRSESMKINGKQGLRVHPLCECPEDAIIGRDLVSCCDVAELMAKAHAAGAAGEPFEYDVIEGEDE
jgi:hypothetical protein